MPRNVTVAEWVQALRSGEYTQGKGRLRRIDDGEVSHCCLGVLCDLADPDAWHHDTLVFTGEPYGSQEVPWDEAGSHLPPGRVTSAIDAAADLGNFTARLTGSNDGALDFRKLDFKGIADLIEAHLPADFTIRFS